MDTNTPHYRGIPIAVLSQKVSALYDALGYISDDDAQKILEYVLEGVKEPKPMPSSTPCVRMGAMIVNGGRDNVLPHKIEEFDHVFSQRAQRAQDALNGTLKELASEFKCHTFVRMLPDESAQICFAMDEEVLKTLDQI